MELWIRSQDKGVLTKANNLIVLSNNIDDTSFSIKNYEQDDSTNLGIYKTKERALEILDEIQELDTNKKNIIVSHHFDKITKITYEMPKE